MPLTKTDQTTLYRWIDRHMPEGFCCPLCKHNDYETGELLFGLWVDQQGRPHTTGATSPMVQILCTRCKHVTLFAAQAIGLR